MENKIKKISKIRLIRAVIQIVFFILVPGLYISAFSGIKQLYLSLYNWDFNWETLLPQMIALLAVIPVTMIAGRFFCGWMCAFGSLGDFLFSLSKLVIKKRKPIREDVDKALKFVKYIFLFVLIIVGWSIGLKTFQSANPWDAFGMLFTIGKAPDFSYVLGNLAPAFFILLAILAASFYVERFFCRYLCPLGAIFAIVSKLRITAIKKPTDQCGNCRVCTKNCPMGIPLYREEKVKSGECINCMQCVSKCPRKNTGFTVVEQDARPVLAGALAVTVMAGVYYAGTFATNSFSSSKNNSVASAESEKLYQDGTYEGSGTGFRNRTTTVSVTVENGLISDISTVSTGDDQQFYNSAFNSIVSAIIESQDSNVDAVSGATYSSNGIMEAVANALQDAKLGSNSITSAAASDQSTDSTSADITGSASENITADNSSESTNSTSNDSTSDTSSSSPTKPANKPSRKHSSSRSSSTSSDSTDTSSGQTTTDNSTASDNQDTTSSDQTSITPTTSASDSENTSDIQAYQDGTYEGSGTGFRGGTTSVSVIVKSGKITDVSVVSTQDDEPFFNRAFPTIVEEIIDQQTSNVDGVSGATYSSNGIMEAVADALSQAQ